MGPTTPPIERPSHDASSNSSQPAQGSRRNSVSTIRPDPEESPNCLVQDLSRWHAQCRPFLLETIQRQTEQNVQAITSDKSKLRRHLKQQLEQRRRHDYEYMTTLNLVQATAIDDQVMTDRASTRLSTSSELSVNSMSSQMSDSFLNDVQQSAAQLKLSLNSITTYLPSLSTRILRLITRDKVAIQLAKAVRDVKHHLSIFGPQMASVGFSDVGLKLNQYNEDFNDDVLKFLALEKQYTKAELRRRFDQTREWKPWKDRPRPKTWKPKTEYGFLTQRVNELGTGVCDTLESAIQTRDRFVLMATEEMNSIVLHVAQYALFSVEDKWEGNMLVERVFARGYYVGQGVMISSGTLTFR